jgi:hypothetical protein
MRVLVAVAAFFAAAASAGAGTSSSGLWGEVTRGPVTPVCVAEQPCYVPAKDVTLVFARNGRIVRRATTNARGRYRVKLAAGTYSVRLTKKPTIGRGIEPVKARVVKQRYRRVDFSIDTGIRY